MSVGTQNQTCTLFFPCIRKKENYLQEKKKENYSPEKEKGNKKSNE